MKRSALLTASLALVCLLAGGRAAQAQLPYGNNPTNRPVVSPYINLLRQGATPAINYSTLVRPELEFRSNFNQLQNQTLANQQAISGLAQGGPLGNQLITGARAGFQTQGAYFQTMTGGPTGIGYGYGGYGQGAGGYGPGAGPSFGMGVGAGLGGRFGGQGSAPASTPAPSRGRTR